MTNTTKVLTNIGLFVVITLLLTGCTFFPGKEQDSDLMKKSGSVTGNDATFTEVSEDDSVETIESEIDQTLIEEEDFSGLEAELDVETDTSVIYK